MFSITCVYASFPTLLHVLGVKIIIIQFTMLSCPYLGALSFNFIWANAIVLARRTQLNRALRATRDSQTFFCSPFPALASITLPIVGRVISHAYMLRSPRVCDTWLRNSCLRTEFLKQEFGHRLDNFSSVRHVFQANYEELISCYYFSYGFIYRSNLL